MPSITLPTKSWCSFEGYFTALNGAWTRYYNADGSSARNYDISSNTTLYASWGCWYKVYLSSNNRTYSVNDKWQLQCDNRYYVKWDSGGVASLYSTYCPMWYSWPSSNWWILDAFSLLSNSQADFLFWSILKVDQNCNPILSSWNWAIKANNTNESYVFTWNAGDAWWSRRGWNSSYYYQIMCWKSWNDL